ncbi:hypothetical protein TNIN_157561 [Trichonephila inaurata madagascariensis]|uniref:Uncharacterized protein n=1 Tax=Trichonephila inaurata madagascariensis TaxID=2747483 RepID=A0A8X6Y0D8_9ARAC|nr:hypothetical protein TNIN_157561 [Trichonephila inaurata madagascariensis]
MSLKNTPYQSVDSRFIRRKIRSTGVLPSSTFESPPRSSITLARGHLNPSGIVTETNTISPIWRVTAFLFNDDESKISRSEFLLVYIMQEHGSEKATLDFGHSSEVFLTNPYLPTILTSLEFQHCNHEKEGQAAFNGPERGKLKSSVFVNERISLTPVIKQRSPGFRLLIQYKASAESDQKF